MTVSSNEIMCPRNVIMEIIEWLKRASPIGYPKFSPLSDIIDPWKIDRIKIQTERLAADVDQLERELKKIGIRIPAISARYS